jgi:hypothetical protein
MVRKTNEEKLNEINAKMASLKARADTIRSRKESEDRKLDTRRKIIIGGMALERAKNDSQFAEWLRCQISKIERSSDKSAFERWDLSTLPTPPSPVVIPKNETAPADSRKKEYSHEQSGGFGSMGMLIKADNEEYD